jgi:hypothetical protein
MSEQLAENGVWEMRQQGIESTNTYQYTGK